MEKLYTVSNNNTGSWLWLRSWTLYCQFRLKLKKVGKTTRPFRYDLNQIPYDYTVEVRNRFKGLYLIECVMNYGRRFMTLYRRQGSRPSPWKSESEVSQSCPTFCDPMDCSLPHSSVHRIFQARVLEWGAIAFSTSSSSLGHFKQLIQGVQE